MSSKRWLVLGLLLLEGTVAAQVYEATRGLYSGARLGPVGARRLEVADVDGDGLDDMIAVGGQGVWTLFNLGDGSVRAVSASSEFFGGIKTLQLLDWNGDGHLDLGLRVHSTVSLMLGDGAGGSPGEVDLDLPATNHSGLAAGDFDGDGRDDLVVTEPVLDQVRVLLGDGLGGVAAEVVEPQLVPFYDLVPGDLDGDGVLDLVAGRYSSEDAGTTVALGDGTGHFPTLLEHSQAGSPGGFALSDVDEDGDLDVASWGAGAEGAVQLWLNGGNGGLSLSEQLPSLGDPSDLAFADLDRDGHLDLLVSYDGIGDPPLRCFGGDGAGGLGDAAVLEVGSYARCVRTLHLDGDGLLDLVTGVSGGLSFFGGDGIGGVKTALNTAVTGAHSADLELADMNGDGLLDAVVVDASLDVLRVHEGNGSERFDPPVSHDLGGPGVALAVADVSGDGACDVAVAREFPEGGVALLINDGLGAFLAPQVFDPGFHVKRVAFAALGDDPHLDLLSLDGPGDRLRVREGDGAGGFGQPRSYDSDEEPVDFAVGDVNGDGWADVVIISDGNSNPMDMVVLLGQADGKLVPGTPTPVFPDLIRVFLHDLDDDGDLDACLLGLPDQVTIEFLANDGSGVFTHLAYLTTAPAPRDIHFADVDGDGEVDLLASGGSSVGVHRKLGPAQYDRVDLYPTAPGGGSPVANRLRVADLEGAGLPDVVTAHGNGSLGVLPHAGSAWYEVGGGDDEGALLTLTGDLTPASPVGITVARGQPNGLVFFVLGLDTALAPLPGGLLVPSVDLVLTLPLDGAGAVHIETTWSAGVPADVPFWVQVWSPAPNVASNASLGVTR